MPEEKGTGKHPHKSTEEPWHHTNESSEGSRSKDRGSESSGRSQQASDSSESRDLKEREYRDEQGNIHHHTHTSKEMKDRRAS